MEAASIFLESEGPRLHLGALLVREGLLTAEQLEVVLAAKESSGGRVGALVVERGWITPAQLARALATQHGLDFLDIGDTELDPAAVGLLPEKFASRYQALPVSFLAEDTVLVAVSDPTNVVTSDDLRLALGLNVQFAVASASDLARTIARVHRHPIEINELDPEAPQDEEAEDIRSATNAPAIKLVNSLLAQGIDEGASDLHFEPHAGGMVVRARVDGVTRRIADVPKQLRPAVTARLKIMGELDIAERRMPQDGRVSIRFGGLPMDIRITVLPTTFGEKVVLRILDRAAARLSLPELGMHPEAEQIFTSSIFQPYGAVISVGPTGSGKTTTLYAALESLNGEGRVLTTIEDPVEYRLPGVNQIEVNTRSGLTFARGLRTILRSDADVLLVGEIRDEETARIAIQAALTGHLVLTTLHTHNAASSIARLKDMGVDPGLIANSINCIVAQRLARRLCGECRESYPPDEQERKEVGGEVDVLYRSKGCVSCFGTGYAGRVALYEVLPVVGAIRRLIDGSTEEIFNAAVELGMTTLRQEGMRLCRTGVSSLDEIRRVVGDRINHQY